MFYFPGKKIPKTLLHDRHRFRDHLTSLLGFRPGKLPLYEQAFIHRSVSKATSVNPLSNNERLEFLGDSLLGAVLSEYLFTTFPMASEGELTRMRSRLVNGEQLNRLAEEMGLNNLLVSHINKNCNTRHIYGDSLEALIGALFIDRGYRSAKKFILKRIIDKHIDLTSIIAIETDFKSQIYRWSQKVNKDISFSSVEQWNPVEKIAAFKTILMVNNKIIGEGEGRSKKESEQEASMKGWNEIIKTGCVE